MSSISFVQSLIEQKQLWDIALKSMYAFQINNFRKD